MKTSENAPENIHLQIFLALLCCDMARKRERHTGEDFPNIRPEMIHKMGIAESISYAHFERLYYFMPLRSLPPALWQVSSAGRTRR